MKQTVGSLFPWGKEVDISAELWREYHFSDCVVTIEKSHLNSFR